MGKRDWECWRSGDLEKDECGPVLGSLFSQSPERSESPCLLALEARARVELGDGEDEDEQEPRRLAEKRKSGKLK